MARTPTRRFPRAGIDPIRSDIHARMFIHLLVPEVDDDEVIAIPLDDRWCGRTLLRVAGATDPDSVLVVTDAIAIGILEARIQGRALGATSIVLVSVRPTRPSEPHDLGRWLDARNNLGNAGATLVEWYIVSHRGIECPRELLGEPPRWPQ